MGRLIEGMWKKRSVITSDKEGRYDRVERGFRDFISVDHPIFKPESDRYHLYVSHACPWAMRTLIYRSLKQLEDHISVSIVHPDMLDDGWMFDDSYPGATKDHLFSSGYLREIYLRADPKVTTTVTVPVLWDKKTNTIVNNESSEIIRMLGSSFDQITGNKADYYPLALRASIDNWNDLIYHNLNNGVYKAGFAKTQKAYDDAVSGVFETLDRIESQLNKGPFLLGEEMTEADLRLIPTLLRFDIVYVTHFKCNIKRIKDYTNLHAYVGRLYQLPAIKNNTNFDHIKRHYYYSHPEINPFRIIPKGPIDLY